MGSWEDSYLGGLRAQVGNRRLLSMGARCVLLDDDGRVLLIRRSDNGVWALPAGTMELGETLSECAIREVREETGLIATQVTPFGLYSSPDHYPDPDMFGNSYQHIVLAVRVDAWTGDIVRETDETTDARWFAPDALPAGVSAKTRPMLTDLAAFERTGVMLVE